MSLIFKNILGAVDGSNEAILAFKRAVQVAINNRWIKIVHFIIKFNGITIDCQPDFDEGTLTKILKVMQNNEQPCVAKIGLQFCNRLVALKRLQPCINIK